MVADQNEFWVFEKGRCGGRYRECKDGEGTSEGRLKFILLLGNPNWQRPETFRPSETVITLANDRKMINRNLCQTHKNRSASQTRRILPSSEIQIIAFYLRLTSFTIINKQNWISFYRYRVSYQSCFNATSHSLQVLREYYSVRPGSG